MVEFATELSQFCNEIVEVVNVDELSAEQTVEKLTAIAN